MVGGLFDRSQVCVLSSTIVLLIRRIYGKTDPHEPATPLVFDQTVAPNAVVVLDRIVSRQLTDHLAERRPSHEVSYFSRLRDTWDRLFIHQQPGWHTDRCGWCFCVTACHVSVRQRPRSTCRSHRREYHRFYLQGNYCDHSRHADLFGACSISAARAVVLFVRSISQLLFASPFPIWYHLREYFTRDAASPQV